jgi:hypothetical protein
MWIWHSVSHPEQRLEDERATADRLRQNGTRQRNVTEAARTVNDGRLRSTTGDVRALEASGILRRV